MPIRPPRLDDRSYQDLLAELVARIPAHTPEWSDPRPGDPGRTLIELFAWLGDTLLYRVNLIPERQRMEFLRMVGLGLRPAAPASGLVALSPKTLDKGNLKICTINAGAKVSGPPDFETLRPLTVLPVTAAAYHKRTPDAEEQKDVAKLLPQLSRFYQLGNKKAKPYITTATFPMGAAPIDLKAMSVDGCLWVAILAGRPQDVEAAREKLGRDPDSGMRRVLSVGVVPALRAEGGDPLLGGASLRALPLVWELTTGRAKGPALVELELVRDGTAGFTRTGIVELRLPEKEFIGAPANNVMREPDAGVGPRPPRLDDPKVSSRLVTWLRLRTKVSVDRLALQWVGINAVDVDQRRSVAELGVGVSDGSPDQRFALPLGSILRSSFALQVEEEGRGWVDWSLVEHLALAGPNDRAYSLDDEEGVVLFGDGLRGKIPGVGRRVRVLRMRAGGGIAGNLAVGSLKKISATLVDGSAYTEAVEVVQPIPTTGGTAAESLEEAERRIPSVLRHRDRAVTAEDLIELAAATPGVTLGRIEVLPGFKPQQRREGLPGVVSVMVLPQVGVPEPPNPRPGRHTIEAVYDWLSPRITLGTELYVIGCEYVPLALSVSVELRPGFDRDQTVEAVKNELRRFLWPLVGGGPFETMAGWPLKRPVRERELEVVVSRVPGVDEVRGLKVFEQILGGRWRKKAPGTDGTAEVTLKQWQLPELLKVVVVTEGEAPENLESSEGSGNEVAIPVVPELC